MKNSENIIENILKTIRSYELLKAGDSVIAACSGGPDSVLLLLALVQLRKKLKLKDIVVCNIDHSLRGRASSEDSKFVRKLGGSLGLKVFYKKIKLPDPRKLKLSTEELGRKARYDFFGKVADMKGIKIIATGHNLDDQAETVLMRIIKGTSLKGMSGISPLRTHKTLKIIRPLIEIGKKEIVNYLDQNSIKYRVDKSNLEPIYFRNVVRSEIIPFLEKYNPRLKRSLFNLSQTLREDNEFIEKYKRGAGQYISVKKSGEAEMRLADIAVQPRAIQKEIARDCLEKAGANIKKLSFRHWKEIERLLFSGISGKAVDLPGGIRARRDALTIKFGKR